MAYADLATIQTTDPGDPLTAAWCDQVRDNEEFLIDPPGCSVYNNAAVSLANSTDTVLNANSEVFDNDSMHSLVSLTSRITAQTPGRFQLFQQVRFASNATGVRVLQYRKNGGPWIVTQALPAPASSDAVLSAVPTVVLAQGDYVETGASQASGGALNATLEAFTAIFLTRQ